MATINGRAVQKVVVACDAGIGSGVMLAGELRRQLRKHPVVIEHMPVNSIPADADVVICHTVLADRARARVPDKVIVPILVFIGDPAVNRLVKAIRNGEDING